MSYHRMKIWHAPITIPFVFPPDNRLILSSWRLADDSQKCQNSIVGLAGNRIDSINRRKQSTLGSRRTIDLPFLLYCLMRKKKVEREKNMTITAIITQLTPISDVCLLQFHAAEVVIEVQLWWEFSQWYLGERKRHKNKSSENVWRWLSFRESLTWIKQLHSHRELQLIYTEKCTGKNMKSTAVLK